MIRIIGLWLFIFLLIKQTNGVIEGHTYTMRTTRHMFPFGDELGDEKMPVAILPVVKDLNDKIIFNRGKFDQLEIFADGRIELHSRFINIPFTPVLSPYELMHSRVTSGQVWYRDTADPSELNDAKKRLQNDISVDFTPRRLTVITWQFKDVAPRYPECTATNRADNLDFCDCLEQWPVSRKFGHLECECLFANRGWPYTVCVFLGMSGDYRYAICDDGTGHRSFDLRNFCICNARGGPSGAAWCMSSAHTSYTGFIPPGALQPEEGCDFCGCVAGSRLGFCHCSEIDRYRALGMERCYLLFAAGGGSCIIHDRDYPPICHLVRACHAAGANSSDACKCLLPGTLTAADLFGCLLDIHSHSYIWLCDDPYVVDSNPLLETYCSCIGTNYNVLDDEIYCKCLVHSMATPGDLCQCLRDQGHSLSGITGCDNNRRSTLTSRAVAKQTGAAIQRHVRDATTYANTFQAVIAHGRRDTYVYFTYYKLEYSDRNIATRLGSVYHDTSVLSGYEHPYPQDVFLIHFLLWDSNIGTDGRWLYKVDGREVWEPKWNQTDTATYYPGPSRFT